MIGRVPISTVSSSIWSRRHCHLRGPEDLFSIEGDPEERQKIADAGATFIYDLLTIEDRQRFGCMSCSRISWLSNSCSSEVIVSMDLGLSSFVGAVATMRAAGGADFCTEFFFFSSSLLTAHDLEEKEGAPRCIYRAIREADEYKIERTAERFTS